MDVAQAAHRLKHGRGMSLNGPNILPAGYVPLLGYHRSLLTSTKRTSRKLVLESYRVILVLNYTLISLALQQIPWIGRWLAFFFMVRYDASQDSICSPRKVFR